MIGKLQKRLPVVTDNPIELSNRVIDSGETDEAVNRLTQRCTLLADGISITESFSHIISFETGDGLVCFDATGPMSGDATINGLREWSTERVHSLVYTHGHLDHVGGSGALAADATSRGYALPDVLGHEALAPRLERYQLTSGWNTAINRRQFGGISARKGSPRADMKMEGERPFLPENVLWPTVSYGDGGHRFTVGGMDIELHHDKGETDDHTWAWIPQHRALCVGDFVTWVFPNCGNPQKVQRFPKEWAAALRKMQALNADWLFGAHGLPVHGAERVNRILDDLATALETLVVGTLEMMNAGEPLDAIVNAISLPDAHLTRPWMQPVYDEPEFVVRNIWRLYGGWWDQNPAHLKPATESALGAEVVALAGGEAQLLERAQTLAEAGDFRLACHLVEFAASAAPESSAAHTVRAEIYQARRNAEYGLMSKGVFAAAANESRAVLE